MAADRGGPSPVQTAGMTRMRSRLVGAALSFLLAACSGNGDGDASGRSGRRPPPPMVYVAVGASESVGVGADRPEQAWPEVLRRTRLPEGTSFTNLGIPGATVSTALRDELPRALSLAPTLVTVWLNANDIIAGVAPSTYESQLRQLVRELRRGGQTKVLVANTPPLELLPAYLACRRRPPVAPCREPALALVPPSAVESVVDAYNAAIARVAAAEGAVLVDLHAEAVSAQAGGRLAEMVSSDGFHPNAAGHRAVADAFADAL